jgi:hypothetical protein
MTNEASPEQTQGAAPAIDMKDLSRGLFACFKAGLLETTATARCV